MKADVRLVELDLSDNAFGPNGMIGLQQFLVSECCYGLEELRLNNNGLGVTGGKVMIYCAHPLHVISPFWNGVVPSYNTIPTYLITI